MRRRAIVAAVAAVLAVGGAFVMLAIRPTEQDACRDWVKRYPEVAKQHGIESCEGAISDGFTTKETGDPPTVGLPNISSGSAFEREGIKWEVVGYIVWLVLVVPVAILIVRTFERVARRAY
jgi:hypothetical protein